MVSHFNNYIHACPKIGKVSYGTITELFAVGQIEVWRPRYINLDRYEDKIHRLQHVINTEFLNMKYDYTFTDPHKIYCSLLIMKLHNRFLCEDGNIPTIQLSRRQLNDPLSCNIRGYSTDTWHDVIAPVDFTNRTMYVNLGILHV
jgi:hypothetical protein